MCKHNAPTPPRHHNLIGGNRGHAAAKHLHQSRIRFRPVSGIKTFRSPETEHVDVFKGNTHDKQAHIPRHQCAQLTPLELSIYWYWRLHCNPMASKEKRVTLQKHFSVGHQIMGNGATRLRLSDKDSRFHIQSDIMFGFSGVVHSCVRYTAGKCAHF